MRIVGGRFGGRVINPPRNLRARPTTDFAKENLFNVLGNLIDLEGTEVLDLFSGTGSISYEFISRGAAGVTSVEVNAVHHNFIRRHGITDHRIRHENGIGRIGKKPHPIICIDTALLRKCVERRCHLFAPAPPGGEIRLHRDRPRTVAVRSIKRKSTLPEPNGQYLLHRTGTIPSYPHRWSHWSSNPP